MIRQRFSPLTPIYDPPKRRGVINTGTTPTGVLPPDEPVYSSLAFVGRVTSSVSLDNCLGIATFSDDYLVVATQGSDRATVIDASNPAAPAIIGFDVDTTVLQNGRQCVIFGTAPYAMFDCGGLFGRFTIVDLTTPTSPNIISSAQADPDFFNNNNGLAVIGTNVFVSGPSRLGVINVSTPASPTFTTIVTDATNYPSATGHRNIAVSGSTLFVGATGKVTVTDVSTPASPTVIGSVADATVLANPQALDVSGSLLVTVEQTNDRLACIDITTPASPTILGSTNLSAFAAATTPTDMVIIGNYAVVTCLSEVLLVDITDPTTPTPLYEYVDDGFTANASHMTRLGTDMVAISAGTDDTVTILQLVP